MTGSKAATVTRYRRSAFTNAGVAAVFEAYPEPTQAKLLRLRQLILDTAAGTEGVGALEETLKWGQPSYLTSETKSGSTIRIDAVKAEPGQIALYVNCQTSLIESFRERYPDELRYGGNRSIILDASAPLPEAPLQHCISLALTYHRRKRGKRDKRGG